MTEKEIEEFKQTLAQAGLACVSSSPDLYDSWYEGRGDSMMALVRRAMEDERAACAELCRNIARWENSPYSALATACGDAILERST